MKYNKSYTIKESMSAAGFSAKEILQINEDAKYHRVAYSIKELRVTNNLTQQQLADKAGLTRSVIARIESGRHNITIASLIKIAESMGEKVKITFVKK
jgi:DNA-binding XRE family transcriptional regulator